MRKKHRFVLLNVGDTYDPTVCILLRCADKWTDECLRQIADRVYKNVKPFLLGPIEPYTKLLEEHGAVDFCDLFSRLMAQHADVEPLDYDLVYIYP